MEENPSKLNFGLLQFYQVSLLLLQSLSLASIWILLSVILRKIQRNIKYEPGGVFGW